MSRLTAIILLFALAAGCSPTAENSGKGGRASLANPNTATDGSNASPQPSVMSNWEPSAVVAKVNGVPIKVGDIYRPMMEAHGLQFMLHLAQLELARQRGVAMGLKVTAEDIAQERQRTMEQAFKDLVDIDKVPGTESEKNAFVQKEYARMLDQLLEMKRISKPEFALAMETGAWLYKIAQVQVKDRISDKEVEAAFKIKYGEKVKVRHIELRNMREVAEALRRLSEEKQTFEQVAAAMSLDEKSKGYGGSLRPFSRAEVMWPKEFKEAAFALETPGEVSPPISIGETIHLLKLDGKIPPNAAVKFEDHREILREELYTLMTQARMGQIRTEIAVEAAKALKIEDPVLKKQYDERMARTVGEVPRDREDISKDLARERPSTQPASQPTDRAIGSGVARPPATRPGK
ncbi:MAG TPA: peptidylprolyl isomerase [Tepidisphaeraceae bacterium]|nr:peptidylprolyl isomerase [Tepidisphaeraceae bacterium]